MLYTLQPQQLLGADVFTRDCYKKMLLDSLLHCQQSQGLRLPACPTKSFRRSLAQECINRTK